MFWKKDKKELSESGQKSGQIYMTGFDAGFKAAWNWMMPYMQESKERLTKILYEEAMNKALDQLEPTIQNRIKALKNGD